MGQAEAVGAGLGPRHQDLGCPYNLRPWTKVTPKGGPATNYAQRGIRAGWEKWDREKWETGGSNKGNRTDRKAMYSSNIHDNSAQPSNMSKHHIIPKRQKCITK